MYDQIDAGFAKGAPPDDMQHYSEEEVTDDESYEEEVFEEVLEEQFEEHVVEVFEAEWEEEQPEYKDRGGEGEETQQQDRDGDAEEQQNGYVNDEQQHQQQEPAEERQLSREPPLAEELEALPYEITILHDLMKKADWRQLLGILADLRNADPAIIEAALSTLDERNSTPLHIAVWKAPMALVKLLMSVIPFDVRGLILFKQDVDGNTPLHLACANLELKSDGTLDMSLLVVLIKGAPNAFETVNWQGDTPLHLLLTSPAFRADPQNFQAEACAEEMVKSALQGRIHLASTLNNSGATLLHVACAHGAHERVLMILLELAPESADIVDNEGMLPLHYVAACISGKSTPAIFAETLVEANQEAVIHPCNTGDTPLHLFVSNSKKNIDKHERNSRNTAKVVEALLGSADSESMCPLLVKNRDSLSPLHFCALFNAPTKIARILMESPFAPKAACLKDMNNATPLHLACASSSINEAAEMVEVLGTKEAAIRHDTLGRTPMHIAAENKKCTKGLIKVLADINPKPAKMEAANGRMPLHVAIRKRADDSVIKTILKIYVKAARKVFDRDNSVLHEACQYRVSGSCMAALLKEAPDAARTPNQYKNLPLHVATAYQAPIEAVKVLLEAYPEGCVLQNQNNDAPIHYAATYRASAEITKMLAEASPETMLLLNGNGETPLDKAKASGVDEDTVKFLKKKYKQASRVETSEGDDDSETSLILDDLMEPGSASPKSKKKSEDRTHDSSKNTDRKESKKHRSSSKLSSSKSDLGFSSAKLSSSKSNLRTANGDKESKKHRSSSKLSSSKSDFRSSSSKSNLRTADGDKEEKRPRRRSSLSQEYYTKSPSSRRRSSIASSPSKEESPKSPSRRRRSTKTMDVSSPSNEDYTKSPSGRRRSSSKSRSVSRTRRHSLKTSDTSSPVKDDESRKPRRLSSSNLEGSMASLGIEDLQKTPTRRAKKGSAARIAAGMPSLHPDDEEPSSPRRRSSSSSKRSLRTSGTDAGSPPETPSSRKRDKVSLSASTSSLKSGAHPMTPSTRRRSTRALLSPSQIPETPSSKMKARMSASMTTIGGRSKLMDDFLQESQHGRAPQLFPPV